MSTTAATIAFIITFGMSVYTITEINTLKTTDPVEICTGPEGTNLPPPPF